ncbi:hypothetical protein KUV85_00620 [Nocardioides panacisoli]|uniref:hypothetical protein n=1 Tax=Nocardioides panacisoli TaxID=627624 RepID=UPI001C62542D|nr:hypothetical protein [Nocardioides panacisoli]QYJ04217.1 hypothetical protein KUV85_00620 [Nocardioides panacisoli]
MNPRLLGLTLPALLLGGCAVGGTAQGVASEARFAVAEPGLLALEFDDVVAEVGTVLSRAENRGSARVRITVTTDNGGRVRLGSGAPGGAAEMPVHTGAASAPAAALVVTPMGDEDVLQPGDGDFSFGARFNLDTESEGSGNDDGNNLLQRGLFSGDAQYKVQLDGGVPSCRIAGTGGEALVKLEEPVPTEHWFLVECSRRGDVVSLRVEDLEAGEEVSTASVSRRTGVVEFSHDEALTIGAKVGSDGTIPEKSTDQFNGTIDGVFYRDLS